MSVSNILLKDSYFKTVPEKYIKFLEKNSSIVSFPAGKYLFREGMESESFYYIISGKVALEIHVPASKNVTLETIPKDHFLGWSWLFSPPHTWFFDGRAVGEVEVISFNAEVIRNETEQDHELGFLLLKYFGSVMSDRITASRMQLMDIYAKKSGKEFL